MKIFSTTATEILLQTPVKTGFSESRQSEVPTQLGPIAALGRGNACPANAQFYDVLADTGLYAIHRMIAPANGRKPFFAKKANYFADKAAMDAYVLAYTGCDNLFLAVATYKTDLNRQGPNALAFRSFVHDLDTNENTGKLDPAKFDAKFEALQHFLAVLTANGFPIPTHVVETSAGLHLYWAVDRDLAPQYFRDGG